MRWHMALLCGSILAGLSQPAASQSFDRFVGFGDSTIDTGWYRNGGTGSLGYNNQIFNGGAPTTPDNLKPGVGGRFTEGNDPMTPDFLAAYFRIQGADPANAGGSNYATGGAQVDQTSLDAGMFFPNAVPFTEQINNYLNSQPNHAANPNALYLISIGANDVTYTATTYPGAGNSQPGGAGDAYIKGEAQKATEAITQLRDTGARYIIVPNLSENFGTDDQKAYRKAYSNELWDGLATNGVNFIPGDFNAVRLAIQADFGTNQDPGPRTFGFTSIGTGNPACPKVGNLDAASLYCTVDTDTASSHLFADEAGHLTSAGQKILADYYYNLVVAPSQISFLPETAVKTRQRMVSNIQTQIDASTQRPAGANGLNFWATGDISYLKLENAPGFPDDPGTPSAAVAGLSYRMGNFLVGGAVSVGHLTSDYSDGRGHFDQDEVSGSIFGAYRNKEWWGTAIGSYGSLDYDVSRVVPVGLAILRNHGTTDGTNTSLALQGGFNLKYGALTHGPVIGLTLQRISVDGFTETGSMDGLTALSFGGQTRDSAVSALGWKAELDLGTFRPFAQLVWSHELASTDRDITASITTSDAPSYVMPGVAFGKDWGTATVGANVLLGQGVNGLAAFSIDAGEDNATSYGGQIGINVAF